MAASFDLSELLADTSARVLLNALLRHIPTGLTIAQGHDANILRVSDYGAALLQRRRDDLENITVEQHVEAYSVYDMEGNPAKPDELPLTRACRGEEVHDVELQLANRDGRFFPILCNAGPITDDSGAVIGGVLAWTDISRQKKLERQLDLALIELNHRVANHLQQIASMASFIARKDGVTGREVAEAIGAKAQLIGRVYRLLHPRTGTISACAILNEIAASAQTGAVEITVDCHDNVLLAPSDAVNFGMLANEIVTNAVKHGFPNERDGSIQIVLSLGGEAHVLQVINDGEPLREEKRPGAKGGALTKILAAQLDGELTIENRNDGKVWASLVVPATRFLSGA